MFVLAIYNMYPDLFCSFFQLLFQVTTIFFKVATDTCIWVCQFVLPNVSLSYIVINSLSVLVLFCNLSFLPCSRKNIFMFKWCCQSSNHWNLGLSKTSMSGILVVVITLRLVSWRKGSMESEVVEKVFMGSVVVHAQRFVVQLQKILV